MKRVIELEEGYIYSRSKMQMGFENVINIPVIY